MGTTQTTYKGVTTEVDERIFEPIKVKINPPKVSYKFGDFSIYYNGVYYFPKGLKPSDKRENKPFEIQGVYYTYKWYQDTFYIDAELKEILTSIKEKI